MASGRFARINTQNSSLATYEDITELLQQGNMFDVVEQMYGMIWYLAFHGFQGHERRAMEAARRNYKDGLAFAEKFNQNWAPKSNVSRGEEASEVS